MIRASVLVRLPVDISLDQPGEAAARVLRDIIEHGMSERSEDWRVELDEDSGIITITLRQ